MRQEGIQLSRVDQLALVVVIDAVIWGSLGDPDTQQKTAGWGPQLAHTSEKIELAKRKIKAPNYGIFSHQKW